MSLSKNSVIKVVIRFVLPVIIAVAAINLVPTPANKSSAIKSAINNWANEISADVAKFGVGFTIKDGEYQRCEVIDKELQLYFSPDSSVDHDVLTFKYDFTFTLGLTCWIVLLAFRFMFSKQPIKDTLKTAAISALAFCVMFILRDIVFGAIVAVKGVRIVGTFDDNVRMLMIVVLAGLIVLPSWSAERRCE